jgi:hypothetical protein
MLPGANAFEIGGIQEDETEAPLDRRSDVTMLHWVENGWMEFSGSTGLVFVACRQAAHAQSFLRTMGQLIAQLRKYESGRAEAIRSLPH